MRIPVVDGSDVFDLVSATLAMCQDFVVNLLLLRQGYWRHDLDGCVLAS
jgi:hypothetical protein